MPEFDFNGPAINFFTTVLINCCLENTPIFNNFKNGES